MNKLLLWFLSAFASLTAEGQSLRQVLSRSSCPPEAGNCTEASGSGVAARSSAHERRARALLGGDSFERIHGQQPDAESGGQYFVGLECYQPSFYPSDECPFPGMCLPGSTCTTWRTGYFPHVYEHSRSGNLHNCACGADCDGSFQGERWVPHDQSCHPVWMSPSEMRHRINGRRILFVGDSLMRQVFLRAVAWMRGMEAVAEHYFHHHAVYVSNLTHDVLSVHDELYWGRVNPVVHGARQVEMDYMWATDNLIARWDLDVRRPKIAVMAINLWSSEERFRENQIPERMCELINDNEYLEHIVWLTAAELPTKAEGYAGDVSPYDFKERNSVMRAWAAEAQAAHPHLTVTIVGVDRLVEQSPWGRNILEGGLLDAHFMCSFLDMYPAYLMKGRTKSPESGDCRDLLNLNVVQLIMGRL